MTAAAFLIVACSTNQENADSLRGPAPTPEPTVFLSSPDPTVAVSTQAAASPSEPSRIPNPTAGQNSPSQKPPQPTPAAATATTPAPTVGQAHIFVIVMEDMSVTRALKGKYISSLSKTYAFATNYHGVARPSLPNHLALAAGDTFGVTDNGYRKLPARGIGYSMTGAGLPWRAYIDGLTAGCMNSPYPYALRHNPFAFLGGACPSNVVPLPQLDADLRADTPRLVWITPDDCHSGHDCPVEAADAWLTLIVPKILASAAWREGGVLFLLWDEGENEDVLNHMPLIVIEPKVKQSESATRYDHYSVLATMTDLLGLPRLGRAAGAQPLTDLVSRLTRT